MVSPASVLIILKALRPFIEKNGWDAVIELYEERSQQRRQRGRPKGSRNRSAASQERWESDTWLLLAAHYKLKMGRFPHEALDVFDKPGSMREAIKVTVELIWHDTKRPRQTKNSFIARLWRRHLKETHG